MKKEIHRFILTQITYMRVCTCLSMYMYLCVFPEFNYLRNKKLNKNITMTCFTGYWRYQNQYSFSGVKYVKIIFI